MGTLQADCIGPTFLQPSSIRPLNLDRVKIASWCTASMWSAAMERGPGSGSRHSARDIDGNADPAIDRQLGLELKGDSSNVYWGAFDAIIKTDVGIFTAPVATFADIGSKLPSIRMKNSVKSPSAGTVITVPREDGLVRVYTQMGDLAPGQRVNRDDVTLEKMIRKTQDVFQPYKLEFPYVDWYTCYEIGQRICDTFSKHDNRVFIAGDACHTHSPKAGQGMNVSMMDSWNLGWKLASVLRGRARPDILATCQPVGNRLQTSLTRMLGHRPERATCSSEGVDRLRLQVGAYAHGQDGPGRQADHRRGHESRMGPVAEIHKRDRCMLPGQHPLRYRR